MSARTVLSHVLPLVLITFSFISFTPSIGAQQCQMAHDKNALKTLQDRAVTGDADAQCGLGKQYEFALGVPQDNEQAVLWLQKSAAQGNIIAQVELGVVFDKMQDYAQALIWYRKAAESGHPRAEYNLGLAYQNGESVPKDMTQAIGWYRKAADQGDVLAEWNLAVVYDHGLGVPQDYSQAVILYREPAERGIPQAQYNLGLLYLYGRGVPKDAAQAVPWLRKAAEQGETGAQYNLGACYVNGEGVDRNLSEGYFWIYIADARAKDSGLKQLAETSLSEDAGVMKKSDIKNAEKRARAWMKNHPPLETDG